MSIFDRPFFCILQTAEKSENVLFKSVSHAYAVNSPGGGALSTSTYREVSPIFLGQNVAKSDIFGSK